MRGSNKSKPFLSREVQQLGPILMHKSESMAEMVSSAIAGEVVSRIFSGNASTSKEESKSAEEAVGDGGLERLEMARIKMEAALETSNKWQITDTSLLHWRKKLKRAAQDCDDAARRCRQFSWQEDEAEQVVRQSSFPRRIAHAAKAFISSFSGGDNDHSSEGSATTASVRRFERLADSGSEFMRFVQLGGTLRQHLFFDPLIGHMFAGKSLLYQVLHPDGQYHCFSIRSMSTEERGLEAMLSFVYEDCKVPKNSFRLGFMLRLSESTDIIGSTVRCLRLLTPQFKSTADVVIKEITHLPTQDFSCVPPEVVNAYMEQWNEIDKTLTGWFRPDALCCQGYDHGSVPSCGGSVCGDDVTKFRLSRIFPEPVCQVFLQCHISLSEYNSFSFPGSKARSGYDNTRSLEYFPPLNLGILLLPHDTLHEGPKSDGEGFAIEAIDGEKQKHLAYFNGHPDELDEMLVPKAIDFLYHNTEATTYQVCWATNHGSAHLCVEKTRMLGACNGTRASRRGRKSKSTRTRMVCKLQQNQQIRKVLWKKRARDFLKLWIVLSSERLRSLFLAWIKQYCGEQCSEVD